MRLAPRLLAVVAAAAGGYATIRLSVPGYSPTWSAELYHLTAGAPFSRRVLPSALAYPLVEGAGMGVDDAWWCVEAIAAAAVLVLAAGVLRPHLGERGAWGAAFGLLPVMALAQVAPARFVVHYPYDTPAAAFVLGGLWLAQRERYVALAAVAAVGAFNRETALMLPLSALAMAPGAWRRILPAVVAVVAVRVGLVLGIDCGPAVSLTKWDAEATPRVLVNLAILTRAPTTGAVRLLVHLSCLPLAWAVAWREIPADLRRLGWVVLAVVAGLMLVGNVDEPRIFAEPVALAYVPVVAGLARWAATGHRRTGA